jgi:hypothetical protein
VKIPKSTCNLAINIFKGNGIKISEESSASFSVGPSTKVLIPKVYTVVESY